MEGSKYAIAKSSKSAVSWIEEISKKQGMTANWDWPTVNLPTKSTGPLFKCVLNLIYNGIPLTAEDIKSSKKEAKQGAAQNMLENQMKLTPKDFYEMSHGAVKNAKQEVLTLESAAADLDSQMGPNPIGKLAELCMKLNISEPKYEEKSAVGPSHDPNFEYICALNGDSKSATAKNKKLAKKRVAQKWLLALTGQKVIENIENTKFNNNEIPFGYTTATNADGSDLPSKLPCSGSYLECSAYVSHRQHVYQKLNGEIINLLKDGKFDEEAIKARGGFQNCLRLLRDECQLTIEYLDFESGDEMEKESVLTVLTITSSDKPELDLVVYGTGETIEDGRNSAAKEALGYVECFVK